MLNLKSNAWYQGKRYTVSTVGPLGSFTLILDSFLGSFDESLGNKGMPYETCVFLMDDNWEPVLPLVEYFHRSYETRKEATKGHEEVELDLINGKIDVSIDVIDRLFAD